MRILILLGIMTVGVLAGSPRQAAAIRTAYEKSVEAATLRLQLATTDAERAQVLEQRPDPIETARAMWRILSGELDEAWTVGPAGWFLRLVGPLTESTDDGQAVPAMRGQVAQIREAVAKHHVASPELPMMCMGLVACGGGESLELLRRIAKENPDREVAGVAALGVAMLGKKIGDGPRLMRERLTMLRRAIIDAADVKLDQATVAELAEEELYIIMNLTKGTRAPELTGVDGRGRPLKLSQYDGQVRLLIFWSGDSEASRELLDWVAALRRDERFAGKDFEVIGVYDGSADQLTQLLTEGGASWPNFSDPQGELARIYRVGIRPTAYVLGADREIHFIGETGTFAELTAAALLSDS